MAKENVKKFYEEFAKSEELQKKVMEAQKDFAEEDGDVYVAVETIIIPIATEAGYEFTLSEFRSVQREEMVNNGISEEELENVSGGGGYCIIIGGNSKCEAKVEYWSGLPSAYACAYIGIGFNW